MEAGFFLRQLHYQELFYLYSAVSLVLGPDVWRIQVNITLANIYHA